MNRTPASLTVRIVGLLIAAATASLAFGMSVTLDSSTSSPAPVATVVTFTATVSEAAFGNLWYRFRAHAIGQDFRILKDYGPENNLDWTSSDHEGLFEIEVDVRNTDTGDTAIATAYFELQALVQSGGQPVITPTSHPLVFLYSAPACDAGSRMRVQFSSGDDEVRNTPYRACGAGLSMNFYLAGMRERTQYSVHHTIDTGSAFQDGPVLTVTAGTADVRQINRTVLQAAAAGAPDAVLLQATTASNPMATDLNGNLIWYYPGNLDFALVGPFLLTRPDRGGYFWGIVEDQTADQAHQIVREFDLTGRTVRQTNAARVNEQLAAMGKRAIGSFHHEARRLPDGKILALASNEQILTDVQGAGPVDIIGAAIVIFDQDLQVVWTWDAFDYLDPTRMATLRDYCPFGGCPPLYLASAANDWIHANAVQQTPDGSLLLSSRSQDWVIKIDYANGEGGGDVLWRLGKDGDFQLDSSDPNPWFSHQHDSNFLPDNSTLVLFDNGNVRFTSDSGAHSRGQVIQIDEQNRLATFLLNADLGAFSSALGSAQKLSNGDYHFNLGVLADSSSEAIAVDSSGQSVYGLSVAAPVYRSFRMLDLYTPTN